MVFNRIEDHRLRCLSFENGKTKRKKLDECCDAILEAVKGVVTVEGILRICRSYSQDLDTTLIVRDISGEFNRRLSEVRNSDDQSWVDKLDKANALMRSIARTTVFTTM